MNEFIKECLSDLCTLYLTFIGILFSILTLLYSFIQNKKNELKLISEQIKLGDKSPLVLQKKKFAISYIERLASINLKCFYLLIVSIILACGSWIGMRVFNGIGSSIVLHIIAVLTLFVFLFMVFFFVSIIKQYIADTKI